MWGLPATATSPRQIEGLTAAVLGWQGSVEFWRRWRAEYISEVDLAHIAGAGFDHVRLPLSWRLLCTADGTVREDGFGLLDSLVDACGRYGLRIVLDLHAAPGGQTGTNIDDSAGLPELFLDPHWKELTVRLWRAIAARYAHTPTVLAYDLLNEPLPYHWADQFEGDLIELYRDLTAAIREVDSVHLIMYEGTRWATDFTAFTTVLDDNSALEFHKYWSRPDEGSLSHVREAAERLGLPLYMGEGGENTLDWNVTAVALYERLGISWCAWPYKTIGRATSLCSLPSPAHWEELVAFGSGPHAPAQRAAAAAALEALQADLMTRPEMLNQPLVNALMIRPPLRIPAPAFVACSPGVELHWPRAFDFTHRHDADLPFDAIAEIPVGEFIEYSVHAPSGEPTPLLLDGQVSVQTRPGTGSSHRIRVTARHHASLSGLQLPAPQPPAEVVPKRFGDRHQT